jgi:hypothetical protein
MQKNATADEVLGSAALPTRMFRQGRNYSTLVGWLLYTVFQGRGKTLLSAILLNLVHLAAQAAAIFVIYWYAKQMGGSGVAAIPFLQLQLNLKSELHWLWAVVILSTACFVISASLLFLSRKLVYDIAEKYYAKRLESLVLIARRMPDPRASLASRLLIDFGINGLATGCRRGALIASAMTNALAALVGAAGAMVFLIRIDTSLTLLILLSAVAAALLLYPLTLRAVKSTKAQEKAQRAFRIESREMLENRTCEPPKTGMATAAAVAHTSLLRRRVLTELVFAIEIGVTVILGVVIYYMAGQAFAGKEDWATFIAYIGALRIALTGAAAAIQAVANISRFYPRIVRYYLFVRDVEKSENVRLAKIERGDKVVLGTLSDGRGVTVKAGERIALFTTSRVNDVLFALISARPAVNSLPMATAVVDSDGISSDAGIALVDFHHLGGDPARLDALMESLHNKVVLLSYSRPDKIGGCGEVALLTIAGHELHRYVAIGTPEAEAAMGEIERATTRGGLPIDEDEEEEP